MSKIVFIEGVIDEKDRERAPEVTETIYAKTKKEFKDSDDVNDNETNNTSA